MIKFIKNLLTLLFLVLSLFGLAYLIYVYLPADWSAGDWELYFRPAALNLLEGRSPYSQPGFFNPPWLLLPLLPLALLPPHFGSVILVVLNLFAYTWVIVRMRMNVLAIIVFVAFSGILINSFNVNVEGLLAIGFLLPPQVGLFFVLCKPQFGIGVAVFWIFRAWQEGGARQVVRILAPVSIAFVFSFALFGFWPSHVQTLDGVWWNAGIFPYGIPIGFILLGLAMWKNDVRFAISSSPFFAPYFAAQTWAIVWLGLLALVPARFPIPQISRLVRRFGDK